MSERVQDAAESARIGAARRPTLRGLASRFPPSRNGARPVARGATSGPCRTSSFEVQPGEVVGIIGRNGAGKSTLLKILSRITEPTEGRGEIRGRVGSLLEVGTGFHPELTGRENIYLNGAILGMRSAPRSTASSTRSSRSPRSRSSSTRRSSTTRAACTCAAFAVAAHLEPEILLVDEVLAVGDAAFQKKCLDKMQDVGQRGPDGALRVAQHARDHAACASGRSCSTAAA